MIIDKTLTDGGITKEIVVTLIDRHKESAKRFNILLAYYRGEHPITEYKGKPGKPNNKVVNNYCKYIVDILSRIRQARMLILPRCLKRIRGRE